MCSSGFILPINLVNEGSFMPTGIVALLIFDEKGANPANSVLVPLRGEGIDLSLQRGWIVGPYTTTVVGTGLGPLGAGLSLLPGCDVVGGLPILTGGV
ncbi:hypothetical protein LIER_12659 [Lithospermum erythrorhizon]|uniref:Uncharacterized protein n=1 Tax=Lithospermum erythrorhizon TaxID=34254 RepID=A0AAV3PUM8_LITER